MKKLNVITALVFLCLSVLSFSGGEQWAAATSGILAAGFLFSDLAYYPAGTSPPTPLPAWRRYASVLLVLLALALFGYQVGRDIKARPQRTGLPAGKP